MSRSVEQAWAQALYGPGGFYRRERPVDHFRTASHAAPDLLAGALARLATDCGCTGIVEVGAGGGELLAVLAELAPQLDLTGVDLRERPGDLPGRVAWVAAAPRAAGPVLLLGWELLDVVPCPVLRADESGTLRPLQVEEGAVAAPLPPDEIAWIGRWWPVPGSIRSQDPGPAPEQAQAAAPVDGCPATAVGTADHERDPLTGWPPGQVVEVGLSRDLFWRSLVERVRPRVAVAVDYDHTRGSRPAAGTLTGYRGGTVCAPVFDGSCDLTAHVALDSVAAALPGTSMLLRQRDALLRLGVSPQLPPHALSRTDPIGYLQALDQVGRAREILDPAGLGGFGWLVTAPDNTARLPLVEVPAGT